LGTSSGGVAGWDGADTALGKGDSVGDADLHQARYLGVGEWDGLQADVEGKQVPVLELAFDVVGSQGDCSLAKADGMQVAVGNRQTEFLVDFADAVGDRLAGLIVATDGDVGLVGTVEGVPAGSLFLQDHAPGRGGDRQRGEGAMPQASGMGGLLVRST
jgi:hypothetical protein